ncbi:MAG TPA: S53 family serine peptidase [Streptosporangiaceae bacterium]|nr:S53 family serine peptidase [Streptosporangiaceae bacterium]
MGLINRPVRAGAVAVIGLAISAATGAMATGALAAPATSGPHFVAIKGSVSPTTDAITGGYHSARMSIEVALAPRNAAGLARSIKAIYTKHSGSYHKWLGTGRFDARYAPTRASRAAVRGYLRSQGLRIAKSSSPFLVRAVGSSRQVSRAFHTTLSKFRDPRGIRYFANSRPVEMPAAIASHVFGVIGLTNTSRAHTNIIRAPHSTRAAGRPARDNSSCQTPYPTEQQLANALLGISGFPFGYGDAPGCNGLTPSQLNSLYGAPHFGARGKGAGVNIGVFELSAYQPSDINTFAQTFFGPSFTAPLVDVNVDGGPLNPQCPVGDQCPPQFEFYAGDIEVDADIETQLAIAPDVSHLVVYNAPNDFTGQTSLDEWVQIANDNAVASVSSSWAVCENDVTAAYAQAENVVFEQMAMQGQSTFGAEGDTGAFSCIRSDGTTILNVLDPPSQPWVTSVGGTSFENFNPATNETPAYPANTETVWNFLNLCNSGPGSDGLTGFDWCAGGGATGGGNSQWWGRPFYQVGPGVSNSFSTAGNGSTQCALASTGTPCREDPDVSANADENTPYAEFCTGNANTPFSICGQFSQFQTPPGWFGIGGTSLSSPLWSAIAADRDSFQGHRSGNLNPLLYLMYNLAPHVFFNDINGAGQVENNNGFFPAVKGFDLATGIGTPKMKHIINF